MRTATALALALLTTGCTAAVNAAPTPDTALDQLGETCAIGTLDQGCGVVAAGFLNDSPSGGRLYWQLQDGASAKDGVGGGVVLFRADAQNRLTPIASDFDAWRYEAPTFVTPEGGTLPLVVVHGTSRGTGASPISRGWQWRDNDWKAVDTDAWMAEASSRLGPDAIQSGVRIDFNELQAVTPLWRANDGHCCPSGGWARLEFEVRDGALHLTNAERLPG